MISLNRKKYKNFTTEELIEKAQSDDVCAVEELIKRYQNTVYASFYYLSKDCSDILDLTQEALVKMSKNIKNLREPKKFKSWLNQIVTNLFYDYLRRKNRSCQTVSIDNKTDENENCNVIELPARSNNPEEKTLHGELNDVIEESVRKLPDSFRLAIVLREFQGLSYEEIASITNTSVGTVKSRIARARNKLQEYLKGYIA